MDVFAEKVYNPKLHRQEVFFDKHYNTILNLHSYGHDIETAWPVSYTHLLVKIEDNNENSKNKRLKTRIVDD